LQGGKRKVTNPPEKFPLTVFQLHLDLKLLQITIKTMFLWQASIIISQQVWCYFTLQKNNGVILINTGGHHISPVNYGWVVQQCQALNLPFPNAVLSAFCIGVLAKRQPTPL